jgi:hypothetical protein
MTALAALLVLAIAAPGAALASSQPTSTRPVASAAAFDKTRFVFDVGTAAFAVHHFIYAPFKAGKLHGLKADLKAAAAALYAVHALRAAYKIANTGNSKLLHAIVRPLNDLVGTLSSVAGNIRHGNTSGVTAANSGVASLTGAASSAGIPVKDVPVSV